MKAKSIYYNGNILTVDGNDSVREAFAVHDDKFIAVGATREILNLAGPGTVKIDLEGKTVIPGLNEGHCHPQMASLSEEDQEIPNVSTVSGLLEWIREQAAEKPPGEWIVHPKMFFTRLRELRSPTKEELDAAAPENPVFLDGTYGGVINDKALKRSGITSSTEHPGVLKESGTDAPTGFLRSSAFSLLKGLPHKQYSRDQRLRALSEIIKRYNRVGITSFNDTIESVDEWQLYHELFNSGRLSARAYFNYLPARFKTNTELRSHLEETGYCTGSGNEWILMGPYKILLDGGILTGTAFMREPWGEKAGEIFGINDKEYRGMTSFETIDEVAGIMRTARDLDWALTAHVTGDGGVDMLLAAYKAIMEDRGKRSSYGGRLSIIHGNFFHPDALTLCRELSVFLDIQAAWYYKDLDAMLAILGKERVRFFHPYRSILDAGLTICSGSDHMVKLDSRTSINPYNPFLGMYVLSTHKPEWGACFMPEESMSRMEALATYTKNGARKSGEADIKGSIEAGKLADFAVLKKSFLKCTDEELRDMEVDMTVLGGKTVYQEGSDT
jgi:predicted amidohydrolase YtcJ